MKYKVETWRGKEPRKWKLVQKFDKLQDAIDRAREDKEKQDAGKLISRVVVIESGNIVYLRGYILKKETSDE